MCELIQLVGISYFFRASREFQMLVLKTLSFDYTQHKTLGTLVQPARGTEAPKAPSRPAVKGRPAHAGSERPRVPRAPQQLSHVLGKLMSPLFHTCTGDGSQNFVLPSGISGEFSVGNDLGSCRNTQATQKQMYF